MTQSNIDLVEMLLNREVSEDEAEELLNAALVRYRSDDGSEFHDTVGLSALEFNAYGHGAALADVAALRSTGWPRQCARCGLALDYEAGFWWIGARDGEQRIRHPTCPDRRLEYAHRLARGDRYRDRLLGDLGASIGLPVGRTHLLSLERTDALRTRFDELATDARRSNELVVIPAAYEATAIDGIRRAAASISSQTTVLHDRDDEIGAIRLPLAAVAQNFDRVWGVLVGRDLGRIGIMLPGKTGGMDYVRDTQPLDQTVITIELAGWGPLSPRNLRGL